MTLDKLDVQSLRKLNTAQRKKEESVKDTSNAPGATLSKSMKNEETKTTFQKLKTQISGKPQVAQLSSSTSSFLQKYLAKKEGSKQKEITKFQTAAPRIITTISEATLKVINQIKNEQIQDELQESARKLVSKAPITPTDLKIKTDKILNSGVSLKEKFNGFL